MADVLRLRLPTNVSLLSDVALAQRSTLEKLLPKQLCFSSYAQACAARRQMRKAVSSAVSEKSQSTTEILKEFPLHFLNCRVLDATSGSYLPGLQRVVVWQGLIKAVQSMTEAGDAAEVLTTATTGVLVDCEGGVLMPGLCDAHVHCTAVTANLAGLMSLPESYVTCRTTHILAGMLARGFTTIRDAGGADFGLAQAVDEGVLLGPRILFTGHALSQTGGHGDFRGRGEDMCACGAALRGIGRVCDGDAEVRRAARDELRRGAHCIKIMASGGVASPTDRLTNTQFSTAELRAIVEEAAAAGTYVCAHAYTPEAITRAVNAGVKSIEHGNYLDESTAALMAEKGVFLVPTLVTYQELARGGAAAGMPQELVAKVGDAVEAGLRSLAVARDAGVVMCFGSDLLGDLHPAQAAEFELRSRVLPAADILRAATINCAELFGQQYSLARIHPGYRADLLLLAPGVDPLANIAALAAPGGAAVAAVFKDGLLAKAPAAPSLSTSGRRTAAAVTDRGAGAPGQGAEGGQRCGEEDLGGGDWEALNESLFPTALWG